MFSRSVRPDVEGSDADRGKESPKIPEFPMLERSSPLVSLTRAVSGI